MRSSLTEARSEVAFDADPNLQAWLWRLLLVAGLWSLALFAYWDTTQSMVQTWIESETYSHGFLILPISLWLIWQQRRVLLASPPQTSFLGVAVLSAAAAAWFAGSLAYVVVVQQFALVSILIALVWLSIGNRAAAAIVFPLAYLYFAVPVGEILVPPMMELTATQTVDLVRLTGVPVYREGLYFSLPTGNWSVVRACSGVRYLIASMALGTLFAYLNYRSLSRRALFIVASAVVPVIANVLRAYMIVMLGHMSGMTIATGVDHLIYGWVFFGLVIFVLFWVGSFFSDSHLPASESKGAGLSPEASVSHGPTPCNAGVLVVPFLSAVVLLMFPTLVSTIQERTVDESVGAIRIAPSEQWAHLDTSPWSWRAPFHGADDVLHDYFEVDGQVFGVSIGVYLKQEQGQEMISHRNGLIQKRDDSWRLLEQGRVTLGAGETELDANSAVITGAGYTLRVFSWYDINGFETSNDYTAKLKELLDQATLRPGPSTRVLVYGGALEMQRVDDDLLKAFADDVRGQLADSRNERTSEGP